MNSWPVTHFFSLRRREVFPKPNVEVCFQELKMTVTPEEFTMHEYDICTYLCLTLSYLQRINYLERKKNTTQKQNDNISTR